MTIREYFNARMDEIGFDEAYEEQEALYAGFEDEEIDLEAWCDEHGVDYNAMTMVGDSEMSVVTLWCYDMCGE